MIEKRITINEPTIKQTSTGSYMVKLKDEKGLSYSLFQTKKDGTETKAWEQMKNWPNNGLGLEVGVCYNESQGEYQGKPYTQRTVMFFKDKNQVVETSQAESAPASASAPASKNTDWDKISWGKCKHSFLIELMKRQVEPDQAEPIAEQWADMSMRKMSKKLNSDLTISKEQQDEESYLQSVPF